MFAPFLCVFVGLDLAVFDWLLENLDDTFLNLVAFGLRDGKGLSVKADHAVEEVETVWLHLLWVGNVHLHGFDHRIELCDLKAHSFIY